MKVEPEQVLNLYFIYLSSFFGVKRVRNIMEIIKKNDRELALKLNKKKEIVDNFIMNQKKLPEEKIIKNIKELSEEYQTLVIYRLIKEGVLKSLNLVFLKIDSLKKLVFELEEK